MTPTWRRNVALFLVLVGGLAIATVSFISSVVQPSAILANGGNLAGNSHALYASAYGAYSLADFTSPAGNGMVVGHDYYHDTTTIPLRDMPQLPIQSPAEHETSPNPGTGIAHRNVPDASARQHNLSPLAMPSASLNFDGIPFPGVSCSCAPPDTDGAVGATQYLQMVNEGYQVFNKTNGASVLGPASINSVWSGFGGVCTAGSGDPIVLYDKLAGRWLISQFAGSGGAITDQCIAISVTSDATGTWHRYGFHLGSNFFDYPHMGTWPDAYYMNDNVFNAAGTQFLGPQPFAFDRTSMLSGAAATFIAPVSPLGSTIDPLMPADLDGSNLPTAGAPESFVRFPGSGTYDIYHFHVDFATPSNSTWTTFATPAAAGFSQLCSNNRACVPESGVTSADYLDALGDRMMFRAAYRRFADGHEALVTNYTVSSGGVAGVRWIELDNVTAGPVTVAQESTYQPDSTWRWLGSAAMDGNGDIAVGFSASSASIFPQLRYAGRLVTDPANTLAQGETTLFAGTGAQTGSGNRWGDYSDMTVDPTDDCTFWYTNEYYGSTSAYNWRTRIGSFKFPSCGSGPTPTNTPVPPTNTPTNTPVGPTNTPTRTNTPTNTPVGPTNTPTNTPTGCGGNLFQNPGFETGSLSSWTIDGTNPSPTASTTQHHSGSFSALVGSLNPAGDSALYQTITVPAGGGTLSYWYWPSTLDTITYDWQDAYVENTSGTILATIMHVDSNAHAWTNVNFNMAPYAGQTVRIRFLAHDDGYAGDPTYMYVDDVSLASSCGTPVPTNTPTNTPVPPTPTNTPTSCGNPFVNGGFENGNLSSWTIDGTNPSPTVSTTQHHSGSYSALVGSLNPAGDSALYQTITVPAGTSTLSYWYWPSTLDTITYDWQDAYVENTSGTILATIMHVDSNARAWTNVNFSMSAYAGQTVRIRFLAHDDGYAGDPTYMYVDDVSLACH